MVEHGALVSPYPHLHKSRGSGGRRGLRSGSFRVVVRERLLAQQSGRLGAAARKLEQQGKRSAAAEGALALWQGRHHGTGFPATLQLLLLLLQLLGQREEAALEDLFDEVEALCVGAGGAPGQ